MRKGIYVSLVHIVSLPGTEHCSNLRSDNVVSINRYNLGSISLETFGNGIFDPINKTFSIQSTECTIFVAHSMIVDL